MRVDVRREVRRAGWAALAAAVALAAPAAAAEQMSATAVAPPLPWQEPAPVARLFLQLPFEAPEVAAPGALEIGVRLLYSNSLLSARNDRLTLDVHVETAQPTLWVRYGVAPRLEAELALPFAADYGGVLDRPIEVVEGWFGYANPQRRVRPRNVARYQLTRTGGGGILRDGAGAGLGDAWAAVKAQLAGRAGPGGQLSFRAALKLPTGRLPYGSEELDLGASLLAGWCWAATAARLELDVAFPTASLPAVHLRTRPYGAVQAGFTRQLGEALAVQLQASTHLSPLTGTGLDQLDAPTSYVLAGATLRLGASLGLEAAFVENVFSPYRGADVTFLLVLRHALAAGPP